MHHKRRRPKNRRRGCILCKPHKMNGEVKTYHLRGHKSLVTRNQRKKLTTESSESSYDL